MPPETPSATRRPANSGPPASGRAPFACSLDIKNLSTKRRECSIAGAARAICVKISRARNPLYTKTRDGREPERRPKFEGERVMRGLRRLRGFLALTLLILCVCAGAQAQRRQRAPAPEEEFGPNVTAYLG